MIQRPRSYVRRWRLLSDRHATDLVKAWERTTNSTLELYAELRRRNSLDDGPGYPERSGGGGSGSRTEMSNRPLEIVLREEQFGPEDPIRNLLERGESLMFRFEQELAGWVSQVQNLPAINPPEFRPREVCVDCGGSPWIVGKLDGSRCKDCRRRQRSSVRRLDRKK